MDLLQAKRRQAPVVLLQHKRALLSGNLLSVIHLFFRDHDFTLFRGHRVD
jgi:hypothetical protein